MNPDIKKLAPLLTADNIQRAVQQNAITPQDLTGNQKAVTVPPAPTPTAGAPIDAYSSLTVETKKAEDEASAARSTGQADLEATLQELMNVPSQRAALEQQAGLAEKQASYDEYTSQLESEQRTLKKQQDAIYSNPMLTREQAQQQFGEIQRLSLSKQADIAVLQSISSRDLTRAQDTIDKKIQNILEPLQMKYDFQKMFYQENREDLTKAQDRRFQVKLAESENVIAQSKATLDTIKALVTTAAQNGAPQSVINGILKAQTAGDLVTAQRLAAPYMVNPLDQELKRAQIASANRANQPSGGVGAGTISPYQEERMTRNLQSVAELKNRVAWNTVGISGALSWVPGSVSRDFKSDVDTLKANITFGELTAMREASKTGGALGQVSDREGALLGAALGSLDVTQSPENFKKNLQKIEDSINRWKSAVNKYGSTEEDIIIAPDGNRIIITD